eukprot:TRINITY_DN191064_c0_g1_i1.p1 TRINITY_DN191064_c0_g1~~TRINITY_DN191064_c0_g1_i1.p1  ORF type:complete len:102 (-),score=0.52 TRINITY_DN191064_c0_g1_i1:16-321(-)
MTIMSKSAAMRASLDNLIDLRYQGVARGVGAAPITGRIHLADMVVGSTSMVCSFTVIEDSDIELILGLDMLLKHECHIDLKSHVLTVADTVVPFLPERDIL